MSGPSDHRTPQESFWAGTFGTEYAARNAGEALLASNVRFFSIALRSAGPVQSCLEFGPGIGMNLRALRLLYPTLAMKGVEINPDAARALGEIIGADNVRTGSIVDEAGDEAFDLVLAKGLLIHIQPEILPAAYERIYRASARLILLGEYYNPSPVTAPYRGHVDRLFKRDFAGDLLDRYSDLALLDYGFVYRRDPAFPQDDITWFLLEKRS